jgi:uncharacterized protein YjeT (DUF2065 family)
VDVAWSDLGAALALLLIIEGVMPFLAPASLRRTMATIAELPDRPLRVLGGGSMGAGLLLLYFVR